MKLLGCAVSRAWRRAEVSNSLALASRAREQHAVLSLGRSQRQLVEGEDLTAGFKDTGARLLSHVKSNNLYYNFKKLLISH